MSKMPYLRMSKMYYFVDSGLYTPNCREGVRVALHQNLNTMLLFGSGGISESNFGQEHKPLKGSGLALSENIKSLHFPFPREEDAYLTTALHLFMYLAYAIHELGIEPASSSPH
jgi:hypothetical protein